jgi:prevent-host-death family protein
MEVPVTDAKAQLTELVRRAEAGENIVLTRHGKPTVRLTRIRTPEEIEARKQQFLTIGAEAAKKIAAGPDAAHSADFLYGDDGLPK